MTHIDVLLARMHADSPVGLVDTAAETLAASSEAVSALADRDGYDTATLYWAAGVLSEAYAAILPHTSDDLPDPPHDPGALTDDDGQLIDLLDAAAATLTRASRAATEPDGIYALARAGILAEQARDALVTAKAPA